MGRLCKCGKLLASGDETGEESMTARMGKHAKCHHLHQTLTDTPTDLVNHKPDILFCLSAGFVSYLARHNHHKRSCHSTSPPFAPHITIAGRRSEPKQPAMTGTGKKGNTTKAATVEILQEHVADLFARSGEKARLVLKYRHCDAKLSVRVTDDRKTTKYTTRRQAELGKIKRLVGLTITGKAGQEGGLDGGAGESPIRSRKGGKHKAKKG